MGEFRSKYERRSSIYPASLLSLRGYQFRLFGLVTPDTVSLPLAGVRIVLGAGKPALGASAVIPNP
jgi:hypothetical protein